jgi:hypothetical protein
MRIPLSALPAARSGRRRNRRGGVLELEIGLFITSILPADGAAAFGPQSKMWALRLD